MIGVILRSECSGHSFVLMDCRKPGDMDRGNSIIVESARRTDDLAVLSSSRQFDRAQVKVAFAWLLTNIMGTRSVVERRLRWHRRVWKRSESIPRGSRVLATKYLAAMIRQGVGCAGTGQSWVGYCSSRLSWRWIVRGDGRQRMMNTGIYPSGCFTGRLPIGASIRSILRWCGCGRVCR